MEQVKLARSVATFMHSLQTYGDGQSYTKHLQEVADTLEEFDVVDPDLIAAAWLHDIVEDTPASMGQIEEFFGKRIARLVHAVTSERGLNRKERNSKTYLKLLEYPEAIQVKLADRISNVRNSVATANNTRFYDMYQKEYESFREVLYKEGEFTKMWNTLDLLMKYKPTS